MIVLWVVLTAAILLLLFGFVFLKISVLHDTIGRKEETFRPKLSADYPDVLPWFDGLRQFGLVSDEYLTNRVGLRIHAYFIPKENAQSTVVLIHGYSGCALQTLPHARMYRERMNCNVVMVDLVHHAQSEGRVTGMGWNDRLDVMQWIELANSRFVTGNDEPLPMALHGLSMGGACALMTAGEGNLPSNVKAIVDDSGYTSAFSEFSHEITTKLHLPVIPFAYVASFVAKCVLGWSYREASALKRMSQIEQPVMVIHGDADTRVVYSEGKQLYDAKTKGYREMWSVKNGAHIAAIRMYPEEYFQRVSSFLEKFGFPVK